MSDQPEQDNAKVEAATAEAVEKGIDISETVRGITLQALSKGRLDADKIRAVVRSVISGAREGAEKNEDPESSVSLREALSGVDEALANSVQASRLAIEEAAGQVGEFSSKEFKRAVDDLRTLEELFLTTVREYSGSSGHRVKQTLNDFIVKQRPTVHHCLAISWGLWCAKRPAKGPIRRCGSVRNYRRQPQGFSKVSLLR